MNPEENDVEVIEVIEETIPENTLVKPTQNNQTQIAGAIIIAGIIIAGAVLLRGGPSTPSVKQAKTFNACFDAGKYAQAVTDSTNTARNDAKVQSTPTIFIVKDGKVMDTINGAIPTADIKTQIDNVVSGKTNKVQNVNLDPVTSSDFIQGGNAGVTLVEYADFQCPFCGRFFSDTEKTLIDQYVQAGTINFVYRDFTFLGNESIRAAQAARCAADQGKFWEFHDYLYSHQAGENQGAFADLKLKAFAVEVGLK